MNDSFDAVIIGGGIIGLATAMKMSLKMPRLRLAVAEKESRLACHQTGHNSGVIHSGIYYRPGSMKARMCVDGSKELVAFCEEHDIPHELCGKVVIATAREEIPALLELHRRGQANGVPGLRLIEPSEVKAIEPRATSLKGLHVPSTGIVDFRRVAEAYARVFQDRGGRILLNHEVTAVDAGSTRIRIESNGSLLSARTLINCAGLYSDRVSLMSGSAPPCRIIPFRGEYYRIRPERSGLVRNLIYPVPDPRFPFLGVHFTRMIDGKVEAGPNAVLAFAREGYAKTDIRPFELIDALGYKGFWRLARHTWRPGWHEMARSFSKRRFTIALQRLIPEISADDLLPGGAGVRAQALSENGALLDDFVVLKEKGMIHVLNAPSPAATSSLAIAEYIVEAAAPLLSR